MTPRDLLAQLEAMPAGSLIPVSWVVEQLARLAPTPSTEPAEVLDVAALAQRWKRSRSATRALLETGAVAGAWKQGDRAWRIRRQDVEAYEAAQAHQRHADATPVNLRAIAKGAAA
ncbi:MAG: hypothetical protein KBF47_04195 [Gemmatimonadales bacterium]|nr:hypothetical protein [Gemmatimonadales bacterium]